MHVNADTAICEYSITVKLCLLENLCKTSSVDKIKKLKKKMKIFKIASKSKYKLISMSEKLR